MNMMKAFSLVLFCFLVQGCTSSLMTKSPAGDIRTPEENMAIVVFMRSSFVAGGVGVELFEINNGELEFVGSLPNGSKIAHKTQPGNKVYMAYGSAADFMIANVEGNKTYFSIVRPNWGTGGFAPTPIRNDGSTDYNTANADFKKWKDGTDLLEKKAEAEAWFAKNKHKYQLIYNKYWARFQTKTDDEKASRTLQPSDGV